MLNQTVLFPGLEEPEEQEITAEEFCRGVLAYPSAWQRVIHGDSGAYRVRVVLELLAGGAEQKARQFALCGRGDKVYGNGKSFSVEPMRCGSRLCPRCSRHRGQKYIRIVFEHLRAREHGTLVHMVLTQPVVTGERLAETRQRLEAKWKALGNREVFGLTAGLLTEHVKWSRYGGWHCHYHLLGEFASEGRAKDLSSAWVRRGSGVEQQRVTEPYIRVVAEAGDKIVDVDAGQGDLWSEAKEAVSIALQYVLRDVCEGASAASTEVIPETAFEDLVFLMGSVKLHRRLGRWRETVPEGVEEIGGSVADDEPLLMQTGMGTVDEVLQRATNGDEDARGFVDFLLEKAGGSKSGMATRTRVVMTWVMSQG